jgi:hypothetical protein
MSAQRFTVEFTFHSGHSLPIADLHNLSSDPYLEAVLTCPDLLQKPDEPPHTWRTPTMRESRDPKWECTWKVSGIPSSGFRLKMRIMDEDVRDRDDRLGKAYLNINQEQMYDGFELVHEKVRVLKRKGSIVPYITTYVTAILPGQHLILHPQVEISLRVIAMRRVCSIDRAYTIGPRMSIHFFTFHFTHKS